MVHTFKGKNGTFMGRNGSGIATGVEVMPTSGESCVMISPVGRRGVINGWVEIPNCDVPQVVERIIAASKLRTCVVYDDTSTAEAVIIAGESLSDLTDAAEAYVRKVAPHQISQIKAEKHGFGGVLVTVILQREPKKYVEKTWTFIPI